MTDKTSWSLPLPMPAGGFLTAVSKAVPVTAEPPPLDDDAPYDPAADAPWNLIESITLTPTRPPARLGWEHLDRCPVCHAERGQACRDMRHPADSGRTVQRAHRGRQQYVSPGYALFLANTFRSDRFGPLFAMPVLARALMSPDLPVVIDHMAEVGRGWLRAIELTISVARPGRTRVRARITRSPALARRRRMHTRYPHRRRPRR